MIETTRYPRPAVLPAKRDIKKSDFEDGYVMMKWTSEASDIVKICWFSKEDTVKDVLDGGGFSRLRSIYWGIPPMRRKTVNEILNAAADLIAEGRIREVSAKISRIYVDSGDIHRHL